MASVDMKKKKGAAAENAALNALRGSLMLRYPQAKAVCLVGDEPFEDKLEFAYGLAKRFAALEKRTLFVECAAMDRPTPGEWKAGEPALADYLSGTAEAGKIVRRISPCLDVIPCGAVEQMSEYISLGRLDALMREMREAYDYIIVDATAMATCADAAMAASCCDGALLLVEYYQTRGEAAQRAKEELERDKIALFGVVVVTPEKPDGNLTRRLKKLVKR